VERKATAVLVNNLDENCFWVRSEDFSRVTESRKYFGKTVFLLED
jgi:hypothetical protein